MRLLRTTLGTEQFDKLCQATATLALDDLEQVSNDTKSSGSKDQFIRHSEQEYSYFSWNFWRIAPYRSTICTLSDGAKAAEPPSLAASGSACDYRQIPHEKYDCPKSPYGSRIRPKPRKTNAASKDNGLRHVTPGPEVQNECRTPSITPSCSAPGSAVPPAATDVLPFRPLII